MKREFVSWITKRGNRSRLHVVRGDRYPFTECGEHVLGLIGTIVTGVIPRKNHCRNGAGRQKPGNHGGCASWFDKFGERL